MRAIFKKLIGEADFVERRIQGDEQGLYLWEIKIPTEDGTTEYSYIRKGNHPVGGSSAETAVHVTFFDRDEIPISGHKMAVLEGGEWKIFS